MNDLPGGMNTRVGATGTSHLNRMVSNLVKCFLKALLHSESGFLALPAVVRGTVVFNAKSNTQ